MLLLLLYASGSVMDLTSKHMTLVMEYDTVSLHTSCIGHSRKQTQMLLPTMNHAFMSDVKRLMRLVTQAA